MRQLIVALLLVPLLPVVGCVEHGTARFETASRLPQDDPRAAGVAVDLTSPPRSGRYRGSTADKVVTLKAPLGERAALSTVRSFFETIAREDIRGLAGLTANDTRLYDLRHGIRSARNNLTTSWRRRFSKHKYEQLPAGLVYRESAIGTYPPAHARLLPAAVLHALPLTDSQELLLHVPIATTSIGNERLFGNELFFLLRPVDGRYLIAGIAEVVPY